METREMKTKRNYALEYIRRIARAVSKGLSKSQARGHPKAAEAVIGTKRFVAVFAHPSRRETNGIA
jgi:hypothetical protein